MDRRRKVTIVLAATALAGVGVKHFLATPEPAPIVVVDTAQPVQPAALRLAAATPLDGYATAAAAPSADDNLAPLKDAAPSAQDTALADTLPEPDPIAPLDPCAITLEAFPEDGAMIGLTLMSPCRAGARVELRHAGLVIAMQTLATGSLFTTLPALDAKGEVEAAFDDGTLVKAAAPIPELRDLRRFAVAWQDGAGFDLNGFEGGADYGDPGHRTTANGGVLALGDAALAPARRAEVYTFPDPDQARITVEAEVTPATCGQTLHGATVYSENGMARLTELTLAMPECDDAGGFVVLNNPLPDTTLAAAE